MSTSNESWSFFTWTPVTPGRLVHPELFRLEGVSTRHCHVCGLMGLHSCLGLSHWSGECPAARDEGECICGFAERAAALEVCDYETMVRVTAAKEAPLLHLYCETCRGSGEVGGGIRSRVDESGVTFYWTEWPERCGDCGGSGMLVTPPASDP